jgi:hypothetical protein
MWPFTRRRPRQCLEERGKGAHRGFWQDEVLFTGKEDKDKGKEYKWVLWVLYSTSDLPQLLVPVLVMSHV